MDLESLITSFKKRKLEEKISQDEIDKTLFIAYNVSLAKTFQDVEKNIPNEKIIDLVEKIKTAQAKEDWESVKNFINENLGDTTSESIYSRFTRNFKEFLKQL